jgi:hypothetical protein
MKRKQKQKEGAGLSRSTARHYVTVWGFLVLAGASGLITLNAYRANSSHAKELYDHLIAEDAAGGDVEGALSDLRSYMYAHMNTAIGSPTGVKPPIQLKGTYDRLVAAEKARAADAKTANANLYNTAQQVCEKEVPNGLSGRGRVPCIEAYVTSHAQSETVNSIPAALYQYDFASPAWSPDTAGFGIVLTAVLFLIFLYRWLTYRRALHHLKMAS